MPATVLSFVLVFLRFSTIVPASAGCNIAGLVVIVVVPLQPVIAVVNSEATPSLHLIDAGPVVYEKRAVDVVDG